MHLVPVVQHPLGHGVDVLTRVPHIGGVVHQQAVAAGGAQGVDDDQLLPGVLVLQLCCRQIGVVHRAGLPGCERNVQHIAALLQQALEEVHIPRYVDLAGLGQLARLQKAVKPGQRRRITAHIVVIGLSVHHIGVKQHGDVPALHVRIGQVHRGAAAQCKFPFHYFSFLLLCSAVSAAGKGARRTPICNTSSLYGPACFCQYALFTDCKNRWDTL